MPLIKHFLEFFGFVFPAQLVWAQHHSSTLLHAIWAIFWCFFLGSTTSKLLIFKKKKKKKIPSKLDQFVLNRCRVFSVCLMVLQRVNSSFSKQKLFFHPNLINLYPIGGLPLSIKRLEPRLSKIILGVFPPRV